ncbi:YdeI/OmpD-associated family protein [Cystobacter ferrugineus]|uniref:Bacteriocin-protection protein n=1 Tax=Cystobacter ferrugineus TaxID=83449 RepID=A0A1L9B1N9_9BACT|nr:YdeI/OmpD-associated family protein [Cystobacter ferrugineus]OJH36178.1 bacteriocin-protection protein [Cystobacter ferrugineus]
MKPSSKPTFFATPAEWRAWLEQHHDQQSELLVGFYKKDSGRPSITWPESVGQALCFGWIDGVRKRLDEHSYTIRFTPRKPRSIWSTVNIQLVQELIQQGLMHPAGLRAFEARSAERSGIYSHEQEDTALPEAYDKQLKANKKAWSFFQAQAPWYQRAALHWIKSAKKEETRLKRLATLIQDSAEGRTLHNLTRTPPKSK